MTAITPRILVVDDYAPNRLMYGAWLRELNGVVVDEAATGAQALAFAREHDYAMFLLDINMPAMDGFELASLLRLESRGEVTPIVFVTAELGERAYMIRGYRMGAVDCLVSAPTGGEILVQKARVFIQIFNKRHDLQNAVEQTRRENAELHLKLEEFIRQQEVLRMQVTHDPLTKLPNRALFEDRMKAAVARAQRNRQRFALAYVDLDEFKAVNDQHGHAAGDALLIAAAQRLSKAVRATDTVARLGGDEFALLFEALDSTAGADYISHKVHRVLTEPLKLKVADESTAPIEVRPAASFGVALYPDHAADQSELVTLADMAMYTVKRAGGGVRLHDGGRGGARPPNCI